VTTHLLDSDWTIDYFFNKNNAVERLAPLIDARQLATSIIVFGEIHEGFVGDPQAETKIRRYDELLARVPILGIDEETALIYAELRSSLRKAGQLMSDNDLWIAATALRHGLTLISRDTAFDRIRDLKLLR
jgi:predicted nucleic acid-binding protein